MEEIPPIELYDNPEVLVRFVLDNGEDVELACASTKCFMASS